MLALQRFLSKIRNENLFLFDKTEKIFLNVALQLFDHFNRRFLFYFLLCCGNHYLTGVGESTVNEKFKILLIERFLKIFEFEFFALI